MGDAGRLDRAQLLELEAADVVLVYLLNSVLFILVGLQLHPILSGVTGRPPASLLGLAGLIAGVVIAVRFAWGFTVPYVVRVLDRRQSQPDRIGARDRLVLGWSGMRGAVSLAAALALPLEDGSGQALPERNLMIFLTFSVIFATLVVQGLTLPPLIRRLGVRGDDTEEREEVSARLDATDAALERLQELSAEDWAREDTVERLGSLYGYRRQRLSARVGDAQDTGYEDRSLAYQRLVRELIDAQRRTILRLRNEGSISNDVMHRIERDLDLEDSRLEI